jgi:hypothetical protein
LTILKKEIYITKIHYLQFTNRENKMKTAAVFLFTLALLCEAGQAVQTDWVLGAGVSGPGTGWGSNFENSQNISWLSIPGQLALSSDTLADPVYHMVDFSFTGAYTVDVGDLNGDGLADVVGGGNLAPKFNVWYSDGAGGWVEDCISATADNPTGCDIADIDGDGDLDVLCATYAGGSLLLFLNDGSSTPQWTEVVLSSDFAGGHDVEAFDIDKDGDLDVLGASAEGDRITWWRNDGGTTITWHEQDISTTVDYPCRIQAVDLDGDGCTDVVASMWLGDKVAAWYGTGGGTPSWSEQVVYSPVPGAHSVRACDIDNDGDPDLIASALDGGNLLLFRNGGGSPVSWTREIVSSQTACGYARPGDMDGDGDCDILSCSFGPGGAWWYENTSGGTSWIKHMIVDGTGSIACSLPVDIDSDGDLDALLALRSQNRIMWYEISEFKASGWLTGSILDTGCSPQWASIDWDACIPGSTDFSVSYRSSSDAGSMGDWSAPLHYPTELSGLVERYFQYRVDMQTSDPNVSPILESIQFNWDPAGIAGQGAASGLSLSLAGANPVSGPFILKLAAAATASPELILFDCSGRMLWSRIIELQDGSEAYISVPELPAGNYTVFLRGNSSDPEVLQVTVID